MNAALALADANGLPSVSLRKVAGALGAGPMRLYGYVSSKDELLDLMVDAAYGEMTEAGPIGGDLREALRTIAHRTRAACRAHPWLIELLGGRPHMGPNALVHLESALSAVHASGALPDIDAAIMALGTVNAYVIGAIRSEASELRAELESGMDHEQWQNAWYPYLQRQIATGGFPMLAEVMAHAKHPPPDAVFEEGLECVLDGIAARLVR